MSFNPNLPFNDLPLLPPRADLETRAILKKTIDASRALSELKGATNLIPNPQILINSISLQEAKSSSEIENIFTTNDSLYKAFTADKSKFDPSVKEVLRYNEALWEGYNELKTNGILTTNLIIRIFQKIKETDAGIRKTPGTKIINRVNNAVIYTPPEGEAILRNFLSNVEQFIHDTDDGIDPIIKSAIIHYQFEAIHPFTDGNGRTGRILFILYFLFTNCLDLPILYLSRYIIQNKNEYYKLLREVTEKGNWESWILYLLSGIQQTSLNTIELINKIKSSLDNTLKKVNEEKQSKVPKEVVELIYEQPYCKTEFIVNKKIAARKAAERYLKELERLQIITPEKIGKEKIYLNVDLFNILSKND